MKKYRWFVQIEHNYESINKYGTINFNTHNAFIECSNKDEACQKANEYYDKTKDLYSSPLLHRFGSKATCAAFIVKKEKLKSKVVHCGLYIHVVKFKLTNPEDSRDWMDKNVLS